MGKRILPTLIALGVFIGLFVWVNLYEIEPIPEPGKDNPVDLTVINAGDVKALAWKTAGRPDLRVETAKDGEQVKYNLVQPRKLRGEEGEFAGILSRFENLRSTRIISATATDTKPFGLGSESPSLTIETASKVVTLTLGDPHPIGNAYYLSRSGDPAVYLVGGEVQAAFRKTVDELREKNLFPEDFTGFTALSITTPSAEFKLEKGKDGNWKILQPKELAGDNSAVANLIFGIHDLRVSRFIEDLEPEKTQGSPSAELGAQALERYGLEKPATRLVLGTGSGSIVLSLGNEDNGERFVKRGDSPVVFAVPAAGALSTLAGVELELLRNKDLPVFNRDKVTSLELKTASGSFKLDRVDGNWAFDGRKIELAKANPLFDGWTTNRIQKFLPVKDLAIERVGDTSEQLKIGLGTDSMTVRFGRVENGQVSMKMEGTEEIWQVPVALYDAFKNLFEAAKLAPPAVPATPSGVQGATGSGSKAVSVPASGSASQPEKSK